VERRSDRHLQQLEINAAALNLWSFGCFTENIFLKLRKERKAKDSEDGCCGCPGAQWLNWG